MNDWRHWVVGRWCCACDKGCEVIGREVNIIVMIACALFIVLVCN